MITTLERRGPTPTRNNKTAIRPRRKGPTPAVVGRKPSEQPYVPIVLTKEWIHSFHRDTVVQSLQNLGKNLIHDRQLPNFYFRQALVEEGVEPAKAARLDPSRWVSPNGRVNVNDYQMQLLALTALLRVSRYLIEEPAGETYLQALRRLKEEMTVLLERGLSRAEISKRLALNPKTVSCVLRSQHTGRTRVCPWEVMRKIKVTDWTPAPPSQRRSRRHSEPPTPHSLTDNEVSHSRAKDRAAQKQAIRPRRVFLKRGSVCWKCGASVTHFRPEGEPTDRGTGNGLPDVRVFQLRQTPDHAKGRRRGVDTLQDIRGASAMTTVETSIDAGRLQELLSPPKPDPNDPDTWIISPMDDMQKDAAVAPEKPVVIMGGSGTGKSMTLRNRALQLVKAGADPSTVTMITFNARAGLRLRQEMSHSIGADPVSVGFYVGTLHKYCSMMLRQAGWRYAGISPAFSICDQEQSIALITEISTRENPEAPPPLRHLDILNLLQWIGYNESVDDSDRRPAPDALWVQLAEQYAEEKKRQNLLDFTDLLTCARDAFVQNPNLKQAYSNIRSRNLLVDEFQDLTPLNYHLIRLMTGPTRSVSITLDPNQSIYQWRGARSDLMQQFMLDFPDAEKKGLTVNHRTSAAVMRTWRQMANSHDMNGLIDDYQMSLRPGGEKPQDFCVPGPASEQYGAISRKIKEIVDSDRYTADQIAILARRKSTIERVTTPIDNLAIPYTVLGSETDEKDPNEQCVTAMLTLAVNPNNAWALRKGADCNVLNRRRNLNNIIARNIQQTAAANGVNLVEAARIEREKIHQDTAIHQQLTYAIDTWETIQEMMADPATETAAIIQKVHDEMYRHGTGRKQRQLAPPITRMLTVAARSDRSASPNMDTRQRLGAFLENVANATNSDEESEENQDPFTHSKGIAISTMHASKGLQWPVVFIADCAAHVIPGENARPNTTRMMEEQRLFYVAVTRAEDLLYLYWSQQDESGSEAEPSPFLDALLH